MFKFFRRHRTVVMVALAFCVVGLLLFGVGTSSFVSSPHDAILKVNGDKITLAEYDRIYQQVLRNQPPEAKTNEAEMSQRALNEVIRDRVFAQEAKKYGIRVTDREVSQLLATAPAFQKEGKFDWPTYEFVVTQKIGMRINDFEEIQKRDMAAHKVNQMIASSVQVPDSAVDQEYAKRKASGVQEKKGEAPLTWDSVRADMRDKETNRVFQDWLGQLNSRLRVVPLSEDFQRRLAGPPSPAK